MSEAILRTKLYEDIANHIADRIRAGEWVSGGRLPAEVRLAEELDVSRSTVREAVRSLQIAGILQSRPGSGTFVTEGAATILEARALAGIMRSPNHLRDLVEARYVLDPQLAALAADAATQEERQSLLGMVEEMCGQTDRFVLMNQGYAFHQALARMSHNLVLFGIYQSVAGQLRGMRVLESLTLEVYLEDIPRHREIAQAVAAGEGALASRYMQEHLRRDYADYLQKPRDGG